MDFSGHCEGGAVRMRELGIFSRTYEVKDLEETCRRMRVQGLFHTQFNLSNAGLDTLPEHADEETLKKSGRLQNGMRLSWMLCQVLLI